MLANKLTIKPCGVAAPWRQRAHGRVPVSVIASQQGPPAQPAAPSTRRRVLPIVSELLEAEAAVNLFERVAGRSAMIGFAVATAVEVLLPGPDTGLFGAWAQSDIAGQFAALGMVLLCCSVGLAARTYRPMSRRRHRLMEPMLCSLTSGRRSFAGVTQQNVDRWVDSVFASVFTQPFVSANFLEEDKYI